MGVGPEPDLNAEVERLRGGGQRSGRGGPLLCDGTGGGGEDEKRQRSPGDEGLPSAIRQATRGVPAGRPEGSIVGRRADMTSVMATGGTRTDRPFRA